MPQKKKTKSKSRPDPFSGLPPLNLNAAGIDIGSREHYVAVPFDRDPKPVQSFKTFTCDLNRLADWLQACRIDTVAMESTGVYWIPLFCAGPSDLKRVRFVRLVQKACGIGHLGGNRLHIRIHGQNIGYL